MPSPHAIPVALSEAERATLQDWTRRRKTAQGMGYTGADCVGLCRAGDYQQRGCRAIWGQPSDGGDLAAALR